MSEAVIEEVRAQQLDLASRVPFTESGATIHETRHVLDLEDEEEEVVVESKDSLIGMMSQGLIDEG